MDKIFDLLEKKLLISIVQSEYDCIANLDLETKKCTIYANKKNYPNFSPKIISTNYAKDEKQLTILPNEFFYLERTKNFLNLYSSSDSFQNPKRATTYSNNDEEHYHLVRPICIDQNCLYHKELAEKRNLEEELKNAQKIISQTEKNANIKTEFLARMSHDMRTPISTIMGLADFGIAETNERSTKQYFRQIKNSSVYLLGLLNDLLDLKKIEQNKIEFYQETVYLPEYTESIFEIVKQRALDKKINFIIDSQIDKEDFFIKVDKQNIRKIFINILNNAIKYTPVEGNVIWKYRFFKDENNAEKVKHVITDTGVGISKEFLEHLFEPFTQEKNSLTRQETGSGLGLAITQNIIEQLGGSIFVESELQQGTKVTVILPVEKAEKKEIKKYQKKKKELHLENFDFTGYKILLFEDNNINALIISRLLQNYGIQTDFAENGKLGIEIFSQSEEHYYDAILTDIRMPVMDGLTAAKKIRALARKDAQQIPIIALSANAYQSDIKNSLEAGINSHIAKPIEKDALLKTLQKFFSE